MDLLWSTYTSWVTIGEGVIVGAGAVITRDVQPGQIVGSNPAEVIGFRKNENWRQLKFKR